MTAEYIRIFTENSIFVNRLKQLLEQENIVSLIKDPIKSGLVVGYAPPDNSVELFVLNKDLKNALPILEAFKLEIDS